MSKATDSRRRASRSGSRKGAGRLHNFGSGTRWIVLRGGEAYGSYTSSHDSLARCAGYESAEDAYAKGALKVHYDPATDSLRVEAPKATAQAIALAKEIIEAVPAALAHVSLGEGKKFRSFMGDPRRVAAQLSGNKVTPFPTQIPNLACPGIYVCAAAFGT